MHRTPALAVAAAGTVVFLEGIALGAALGFELASTGSWPALGIDRSDILESAVWVTLMAAAVLFLRTRRARFWPVALALSSGLVIVTFVRLLPAAEDLPDALHGSLIDGVGFFLGLLFFDFLFGFLARSAPGEPA